MKKPIIAITGNHFIDKTDQVSPHMTYCATGFLTAIQHSGGIPLILPIANPDLAKEYVQIADKFIFTGGQHVSPVFFQEEKTIISEDYLIERDRFELALIKEVLKAEKPLFSVCRGTQLFNVAMGGSLHQSIPNHWLEDSQTPIHPITIKENSILSLIYSQNPQVNSFHHQAIKDLASGLTVTAYATEDKTIEAIERTDGYPYLGVQWHPELLFHQKETERKLFEYVVNKL